MNSLNNTDVIFMTTAKTKAGEEETVHKALSDVASAARSQPGCVDYHVLHTAESPAVTVNVERWKSNADRETFLDGPDVKKFASAVSGAFAEPPRPLAYQVLDEA